MRIGTASTRREGVWKGVPLGMLSGVIMSVVRTGTGVVDTVAFMVPAPGYYDPMLDPAYVWKARKRVVSRETGKIHPPPSNM